MIEQTEIKPLQKMDDEKKQGQNNKDPELKTTERRGRPKGSTNTTAEEDFSSEMIIEFVEGIKKETSGDNSAKISPKIKTAFHKSLDKTRKKYDVKMFEEHPEAVLSIVSIYMIIDAIGRENITKFIKSIIDKVLELWQNQKTA